MTFVSKTLFALSCVLYVVALLNDGYYVEGSNPEAWASAWGLLLMGWMGLFSGVFAWLANPLLFVAWMLLALRLTQAATICTIGAILCIGSFLLHDSILIDEAGGRARILGYGAGYWLWLSSAIVFFAACISRAIEVRKLNVPVP
jgi:hypothetical protein